jgi:uronate dehydrogenase
MPKPPAKDRSRMPDRPVLITGAAGRMGKVLSRGLAEAGVPLRLTDLRPPEETTPGAEFLGADITDPAAVAFLCEGISAVVHLAGHPNSRDWDVVERLNMTGTRIVLEAAARAGAERLIYASSVHAVGLLPADAALDDDPRLRPDSPYGLSKAYGELLLEYLAAEHGVTGFALRICSFRPAPSTARELITWISPADTVRLVLACLTTEAKGSHRLWGVSANRRARVDREAWGRVGYAPQDEAEDHLEALAAAGVDVAQMSEHPLLGAHFVSDAILSRRDD